MDFSQVSTIVTAIATVAYAVLTLVIVRETVRLRKAQTEPEIVLYIQPEERFPNFIDIVIKNVGSGAAYDLKWGYDRDAMLASSENFGINRMRIFDGVSYFAPGQEIRSFFASGYELFGTPKLPPLHIRAEYYNSDRDKHEKTFVIDPMLFYGRSWIGSQNDLADTLKDIQRDLHRLSTGFRRLKVDVYDKDDRGKEREAFEDSLKKKEAKTKKTGTKRKGE